MTGRSLSWILRPVYKIWVGIVKHLQYICLHPYSPHCSISGQLQTDPEEVQAVAEWPVLETQLQCFLGVAYFYRHCIKNYSKAAAPLTRLTSTMCSFSWTPKVDATFCELKCLFTSAPISHHPTHIYSSSWRWMPLTLELGQCYPREPRRMKNVTPVPFFFLDVSPRLSKIMTYATENSQPLS